MERLIITIHPDSSDTELLEVSDALYQVIDVLKFHDEARRAVAMPEEPFEWKLESASTNSPLRVTARAVARDPRADISRYVRAVTKEFSSGLAALTEKGEASWWMGPDTLQIATKLLERNQNGIARTEVRTDEDDTFEIDRKHAAVGMRTIAAVDVFSVDATASETQARGEVIGVLVNAGFWNKGPAIRLFSPQYGHFWCRIPPDVAKEFGHEQTLESVWKGKTLGVDGRLFYSASGKLNRVVALDVREIPNAPPVDLDSLVDPDFTDGLDPVEYLRRLHEGTLA